VERLVVETGRDGEDVADFVTATERTYATAISTTSATITDAGSNRPEGKKKLHQKRADDSVAQSEDWG